MKKIEALKKTIYNLENGIYKYKWMDMNNCSCGVVAKTILEDEPKKNGVLDIYKKLGKSVSGFAGCYEQAIEYCATTGLELPRVFMALKETGFTFGELKILEDHDDYQSFLSYLKAWVEILEQAEPQPSHTDITKSLAILPIDETADTLIHVTSQFDYT